MNKVKLLLLVASVLHLSTNACTDLGNRSKQDTSSSQQQTACVTRYLPVGNDPEIALDTQRGSLCRTVSDTNDPLGILDPACGVSQQYKKLGFVPNGCKSGQTWVKGEGDKNASRYASLPRCNAVIVVTEEDMKKAGVK